MDATGGCPSGERWLVRHWQASFRRAVVCQPLAGAPQESGGWSATGWRPSGERWLVYHWQAPFRKAVVSLPLAGAPQESGGWAATGMRPSGERLFVRHWRAPLKRAVVGPPLDFMYYKLFLGFHSLKLLKSITYIDPLLFGHAKAQH